MAWGDGRLYRGRKPILVDGLLRARSARQAIHRRDGGEEGQEGFAEACSRCAARRRDPDERRVTLGDLVNMVETDYEVNARRSRDIIQYPLRHVLDYFDAGTRPLQSYRSLGPIHRGPTSERSGSGINRNELALVGKAFTLAVRARKLRTKPYIPKPDGDPSRVRQGFFTRDEVTALCGHLTQCFADVVRFLFFSAWRVGGSADT